MTVPGVVLEYAQRHEESPAQYSRTEDGFVPTTALEMATRVARLARWLSELGVDTSQRVCLMAATRPEWVLLDLAVTALGAVVVPIYPTLPPESVRYIMQDSGARLAVLEHDAMRAGVPDSVPVLVMNGGEFGARLEGGPGDPAWLRKRLAAHPGRDHLATIVYTSGTTADPRGVMLSHANLLANMASLDRAAREDPSMAVGPDDRALSFLPLSHIFERLVHLYFLSHGVQLYYSHADRLAEDMKLVRPTVMTAVPRIAERVYAAVEREAGKGLRGRVFRAARRLALRRGGALAGGPPLNAWERLVFPVYDGIVFARIRGAMGGSLRYVISGGAALRPDLGRFFLGAGVPFTEGYGLTETSPVIAVNHAARPRFGTVGPPLPGVEVRLAEDGEIVCRGESVMQGYWKRPAESAAALADGWFHTGDLGEWDGECLRVVDRKKSVLVLSTGKNVVPAPIEQALESSTCIETAVLLGDGQKYVAALLVLDVDNVRASLDDPGLPPDPSALGQRGDVRELLQSEVARLTARFPAHEQPKAWAILPRPLSEREGELTPSLKVKLRVVRAHFRTEVESLYPSDPTDHLLDAARSHP